jgi:transposase
MLRLPFERNPHDSAKETEKNKPKHRPTKRGKKVAWKLDDANWDRIKDVFPVKVVGPAGGRPRVDNRRVFEALIWFARAPLPLGANAEKFSQLEHMPPPFDRMGGKWNFCRHPSASPCSARRTRQVAIGRNVPRRLIYPRKKRGECVGKTKAGKGSMIMVTSDANGIPLNTEVTCASTYEGHGAEKTIKGIPRKKHGTRRKCPTQLIPERVIADKGYDDDNLRERFAGRGIDFIVPYRDNRVNRPLEDRRKLRRYRRRWKVEQTNACLKNFRRVTVQWDRNLTVYKAFVHIACICHLNEVLNGPLKMAASLNIRSVSLLSMVNRPSVQ